MIARTGPHAPSSYNFKRIIDTAPGRERRYRKVCSVLGLAPRHRVLDIGCGVGSSFEAFNSRNEIVGVDLVDPRKSLGPRVRFLRADAAALPFRDNAFDAVVSIGVLEHVFPETTLRRVASEIRRVARGHAIVVPHFLTPIEPHHQLPFWQHAPLSWRRFVARHVSITWYPRNPAGQFRELNYLSRERWQDLFPESTIVAYNHVRPGLVWDYLIVKPVEERARGRLPT